MYRTGFPLLYLAFFAVLLPCVLSFEYSELSAAHQGLDEETYGGHEPEYEPHYPSIHTERSVKVLPMTYHPKQHKINAINVDSPEDAPLVVNLRSKSSSLIVNSEHIGALKGSIKKSKSVDAPHVRVHETLKPVFQDIREIVSPHRKITQYINPVSEKITTHVSSAHKGKGGYGKMGGHGLGSYGKHAYGGKYAVEHAYGKEELYGKEPEKASYGDSLLDYGHGLDHSSGYGSVEGKGIEHEHGAGAEYAAAASRHMVLLGGRSYRQRARTSFY